MTAPAVAAELAATMDQLARLGQEHTQLLARHLQMADAAQGAVLELEATRTKLETAQAEIGAVRAVNAHLQHLITSGRLRELSGPVSLSGPEATELLVAAAHALAPDANGVIGLLLSAAVNGCLLAEYPRGALQAAGEIFAATLHEVEAETAGAASPPARHPPQEPS